VFPVTIVVVSRLVYRKGVDLLAQIIADVCLKNQKVFIYKSNNFIYPLLIKYIYIFRFNLLLEVMVLNVNFLKTFVVI